MNKYTNTPYEAFRVKMTNDNLFEIASKIAAVDERTKHILSSVDKIENNFSNRMDELEDRVGGLEDLKNKGLGIICAVSLIVSLIAPLASDYVKDKIFPTATIENTQHK